MGAVILVFGALTVVAESAAATQASYQITALKQEQAQLQATSEQLQTELAQATAANRVDAAARLLGMTHPSHWQYLSMASSPIALGPHSAQEGRPASLLLNQLVAVVREVIGRPVGAVAHPG
jgi:cell division protein FtsL